MSEIEIIDDITRTINIESNFEYIPEGTGAIKTVPSLQAMIRIIDEETLYLDIFYRLNGLNAPYRIYWEHIIIIKTQNPSEITVNELLHNRDIGVIVDAFIIQNIDNIIGGEMPLFTELVEEIYDTNTDEEE